MKAMRIVNQRREIVSNTKRGEEERICIAVTGAWKGHPAGDYEVSEGDLIQILENFKNEGRELLFDYDHNSLFSGESKAAGWGRELEIKEGKLYCKVKWTPTAFEQIQNREYRYLSNVLIFNYKDENNPKVRGTYLHSVALTNVPFQKELPAIINKRLESNKGGKMKELFELLGVQNEEEGITKVKNLQEELERTKRMSKELSEQVINKEIELAIVEGKLLPADKEIAIGLYRSNKELFEKFISNRKVEIEKIIVPNNKKEGKKEEEDWSEFLPIGGKDETK